MCVWQRVHEARVKNGDIIACNFWALLPGGEDQGFQYLTVTLHNDSVKMMEGGDFKAAFKAAFPNISAEE